MTTRYSNPSGGIGVNRFKVWPVKTTDSFNTADLVANFDLIDAMFGVPSGATPWPPTTGIDGGLYALITQLQGGLGAVSAAPIGSVISWWRPNSGIAIPTGWVELAGQTLTSTQHSFAGGGTIVLPDTRGKYVIGADSTKTANTAWLLPGDVNVTTPAGAPGLGYVSGSNQSILTLANMAPHDHGGGVHGHTVNDSGHTHGVIDAGHNHGGLTGFTGFSNGNTASKADHDLELLAEEIGTHEQGDHQHTIPTDNAHVTIQSAGSNISVSGSGTVITSQGSATPFDNRPGSVGLIILMKVK